MERKLFPLIMALFFITLSLDAHKINGYRFIHIEETGNTYDIENKLTKYFQKIGFKTIASFEIEDMSNTDKSQLLIATYRWNIAYGAPSTLTLSLTDVSGAVVFKSTMQGMALTAKGDMNKAINKILEQLDRLHYSFDPNTIKVKTSSKSPFASWSEDHIKNYLKNNKSPMEGIYKNYSNQLDYYRIAILYDNGIYYGVVLETDNKRWDKGETKMILKPLGSNNYDIEYFDFNGNKLNALGSYKDRVLTINTGFSDGKTRTFDFIKVYPFINSSGEDNATETELKGTGSGFVISGNIIATNYHVIADAEFIKVVLNRGGSLIEYRAKVLSTDKINDIALLSIKDNLFKPLPSPPYSIASNMVDVGTSIFTMGYPLANVLGSEVKITDGIISSKTGYDGNAVTYQISAPIQPGNSGGALFDKKGHLIGITNAGIPSADNIGYAIKSSYLLNLIDSAPIDIPLPKGKGVSNMDFPQIIKAYTPYVALIKVF